jgi:hypothetical protein
MRIVVEVALGWVALSCVVGPALAWIFFYPERRANAIHAAHDRWVATHPTSPLESMPAWLRWENTTTTTDVAAQQKCAGVDVAG